MPLAVWHPYNIFPWVTRSEPLGIGLTSGDNLPRWLWSLIYFFVGIPMSSVALLPLARSWYRCQAEHWKPEYGYVNAFSITEKALAMFVWQPGRQLLTENLHNPVLDVGESGDFLPPLQLKTIKLFLLRNRINGVGTRLNLILLGDESEPVCCWNAQHFVLQYLRRDFEDKQGTKKHRKWLCSSATGEGKKDMHERFHQTLCQQTVTEKKEKKGKGERKLRWDPS